MSNKKLLLFTLWVSIIVLLFACEKGQDDNLFSDITQEEAIASVPLLNFLSRIDTISFTNELHTTHQYMVTIEVNKKEVGTGQNTYEAPSFDVFFNPVDQTNEISFVINISVYRDNAEISILPSITSYPFMPSLGNFCLDRKTVTLLGKTFEEVCIHEDTSKSAFSTIYSNDNKGIVGYKGRNNALFVLDN